MRVYTAPAKYRRHLEAVLAIELARIGRDVTFRDRMEPDLAPLAPINAASLDADADGRLVILFGVAESDAGHAIEALVAARTPRETSPL